MCREGFLNSIFFLCLGRPWPGEAEHRILSGNSCRKRSGKQTHTPSSCGVAVKRRSQKRRSLPTSAGVTAAEEPRALWAQSSGPHLHCAGCLRPQRGVVPVRDLCHFLCHRDIGWRASRLDRDPALVGASFRAGGSTWRIGEGAESLGDCMERC